MEVEPTSPDCRSVAIPTDQSERYDFLLQILVWYLQITG